jgi:hypothetical protein
VQSVLEPHVTQGHAKSLCGSEQTLQTRSINSAPTYMIKIMLVDDPTLVRQAYWRAMRVLRGSACA